jgi:hypothetical protein
LLSDSETKVLLSDRVAFKLFAAEQHLIKLRGIDSKHGIITKNRIYAEMEIDYFFAQIIGAKDSLLVKINEKFDLNIPINEVNLDTVYRKLKRIGRGDLLLDLKRMADDKESWFWLLNELRNHSIHRNILNNIILNNIIYSLYSISMLSVELTLFTFIFLKEYSVIISDDNVQKTEQWQLSLPLP